MLRYAWRELVRNPRRTLSSMIGVALGVGLFSGVLFFIDGSSATMTDRALAPLALDMQRVLTSSLGGGLRLTERIAGAGSPHAGDTATVRLTVTNGSVQPAHDVVVNDEPPLPLSYIPGTTAVGGHAIPDRGGQSPLAQGLARAGLNVGTVAPGASVRLAYRARTSRPVKSISALRPRATVSSREDVVPLAANAPAPLTQAQLAARIARIPGVGGANGLSFVDLPPGSLRVGGSRVQGPVRVFGFDRSYQQRYPSIQLSAGGFARRGALLSAEPAQAAGAGRGTTAHIRLPGARLSLPVSGIADLSLAKPLFYSRNSTKLEAFLYVPDSLVVSPRIFARDVIPAFQAAHAAQGTLLKSPPVSEVDIRVDRSILSADPAAALAQTKAIAHRVNRIAPGQDYLIDNISNALAVAAKDASVGRRMFLFLGLPGILLAAFLAAYAGSILAGAQRREHALLRVRGADRKRLRRLLLYRVIAFAGAGSFAGTGLGFLGVAMILGSGDLLSATTNDLVTSGLLGLGGGMLVTGVALYVPARLSLAREVGGERAELRPNRYPAWRRFGLDFVLLALAGVAEVVAFRSGAFDATQGSVYAGQSVSLPSHLLLAPLVAWVGGTLLAVRVCEALAARSPGGGGSQFGSVVFGTLGRGLRRRSRPFAAGVMGVAVVTAFGMGLASFAATYDHAKAADSRFTVGSDLRLTPSPLAAHPASPRLAPKLDVPGVAAVTPVVAQPENAVLIGPHNQDLKELAAIDPRGFQNVAPLSDSFFTAATASQAMSKLLSDPRALLVDSQTAGDLGVGKGEKVSVLLARGTKQQALAKFRVVGLFNRFPGFPEGVNLVANAAYYNASTATRRVDFFLARATDGSPAGIAHATASLEAGPEKSGALAVDSTQTTLNKDQSSLTALNVHGLVDLDSAFTFAMALAAIAIFVAGLILQRRREYVTLRALGMRAAELRRLVLGEVALVAGAGLAAGVAVGTVMAFLMVHVLRGLFILDPSLAFPAGPIALLSGLVAVATLTAALAASAVLERLRTVELLREQ